MVVSVWPIDENLTETTTPGPSRFGSNGNEEVSTLPRGPELEPRHKMQFSLILRTLPILIQAVFGENGQELCYFSISVEEDGNYIRIRRKRHYFWDSYKIDILLWLLVSTWFGLVLWHINHCRLFNAKFIFIQINSSISNNSVWHKCTV